MISFQKEKRKKKEYKDKKINIKLQKDFKRGLTNYAYIHICERIFLLFLKTHSTRLESIVMSRKNHKA